MDYLLWEPTSTIIYFDHANMVYTFPQLAMRRNVPRYVLAKVHHWAIHMSRFEFVIEHIPGIKNIFADLLSRSSRDRRVHKAVCGKVAPLLYQSIIPESTQTKESHIQEIKCSHKGEEHLTPERRKSLRGRNMEAERIDMDTAKCK